MLLPNLITQQLMQCVLQQLLQIGINVPVGRAGMERWRKVTRLEITYSSVISRSYRMTITLSIHPLWLSSPNFLRQTSHSLSLVGTVRLFYFLLDFLKASISSLVRNIMCFFATTSYIDEFSKLFLDFLFVDVVGFYSHICSTFAFYGLNVTWVPLHIHKALDEPPDVCLCR